MVARAGLAAGAGLGPRAVEPGVEGSGESEEAAGADSGCRPARRDRRSRCDRERGDAPRRAGGAAAARRATGRHRAPRSRRGRPRPRARWGPPAARKETPEGPCTSGERAGGRWCPPARGLPRRSPEGAAPRRRRGRRRRRPERRETLVGGTDASGASGASVTPGSGNADTDARTSAGKPPAPPPTPAAEPVPSVGARTVEPRRHEGARTVEPRTSAGAAWPRCAAAEPPGRVAAGAPRCGRVGHAERTRRGTCEGLGRRGARRTPRPRPRWAPRWPSAPASSGTAPAALSGAAPTGSKAMGLVTTDVAPGPALRATAPGTDRMAGGLIPTSVGARARPGAGVTMRGACGGAVRRRDLTWVAAPVSARCFATSFHRSAAVLCRLCGERGDGRARAPARCARAASARAPAASAAAARRARARRWRRSRSRSSRRDPRAPPS